MGRLIQRLRDGGRIVLAPHISGPGATLTIVRDGAKNVMLTRQEAGALGLALLVHAGVIPASETDPPNKTAMHSTG